MDPTRQNRIHEISDSVVEIDRRLQLGFNWELVRSSSGRRWR